MTPHRIAWVLTSTAHGLMIVNRFDVQARDIDDGTKLIYGVGNELLEDAQYEAGEIIVGVRVLNLLRKHREPLIGIVDAGANIGTHAIAWGDYVRGWGHVYAIEAQRMVYMALCGNIVINNLSNVYAYHAVASDESCPVRVPDLDYFHPASFGSLEVKPSRREVIGQPLDYEVGEDVDTLMIDAIGRRIDLLKIDVEGMEMDVLRGGEACIERDKPVIMVEWLKSDQAEMRAWLGDRGYFIKSFERHAWLAIHEEDPVLADLREEGAL